MSVNPYSPPKSDLEAAPPGRSSAETLLSDPKNRVLGRRFLGTLIDYVVCASFLLVPDTFLGNAAYQKTLGVWLLLLAAYFPLMEGLSGYSVGKLVTRVRVVDNAGNSPGFKKATIRTLFRLLEVNPFLFGGIPAGLVANFSKYGQRLGDMTAGTYVVASNAVAQLKR